MHINRIVVYKISHNIKTVRLILWLVSDPLGPVGCQVGPLWIVLALRDAVIWGVCRLKGLELFVLFLELFLKSFVCAGRVLFCLGGCFMLK